MIKFLISLLFFTEVSFACGGFSTPKSITLKGASFSGKITAQVKSKCDMLQLFVQDYSPTPAEPSVENSMARFTFTKTDPVCVGKASGECINRGIEVVRVKGKIVATIESTDTTAFLFSVNANGTKDLKKPYLKFIKSAGSRVRGPGSLGEIKVEAYDKEQQVGEMTFNGGACGLRGAGTAQDGELDLNGKRYKASSGCGSSGRLDEEVFSINSSQTSDTAPKPAVRAPFAN